MQHSNLATLKVEGEYVSYDDILVTIAFLKEDLKKVTRSKRLINKTIETLSAASAEIARLRQEQKKF